MAFNIQGAIQSLIARSGASSQHACARFVRMAMESGGLNTSTRPNWAWKYIQWLPTQGWSLVGNAKTNESQAEWTRSSARPGDVAVYQKPGAGGSQPGHICMFTGSQWISDFRQNRMGVYASPVNAYIFRYTGEISNSPISLEELGVSSVGGGAGGPATFETLNAETLAEKCPEDIEFINLWERYHLLLGARSPIIQDFMSTANMEFGDMPGIGEFVGGGVYEIPGGFPNDAQLQKYVYTCEGHVTVKWALSPDGPPLADSVCPGYDLPGGVHAKVVMDAAGITPELALGGRSLNQCRYIFCRKALGAERGNGYTAYLNKGSAYSSDLEPPAEYWARLIPYYRDRIIEGWNQPIAQREPDLAKRWALCHGMCWGYSHGYKNAIYRSYAKYANTDDFIARSSVPPFIKNAYKHGVQVATQILKG